MFRNLAGQLAASSGTAEKKTMSPTLRSDIYTSVDLAKTWISNNAGGQAGDGVSYGPILAIIQKHFPDIKMGLDSIGKTESEVAIVVSGITNMALEMSKWESLGGAMAVRTWVDTLVNAFDKVPQGSKRRDMVARGITKGINKNTDVSLMTKDFTAKIQIISCLKSLSSRIYGAGSEEARQAEATLSSRFI